MKLIVILLIANIYAYAQDNLNPQPQLFDYNGHTDKILSEEGLGISKPFIIGWQWGGHPRIAKALKTNMIQSGYSLDNEYGIYDFRNYTDMNLYDPANNIDERIFTVLNPGNRDNHHFIFPSNAQALIFKAALEVPEDEHFIPLTNDIDSAIWGFKYKHPSIINNTTTQNFNGSNIYRIKLEKDNGYDGQTVLKDVYPNNVLGKRPSKYFRGPYLLSINLRRLSGGQTGSDNDIVLKIRLKGFNENSGFTDYFSTNYKLIPFYRLPDPNNKILINTDKPELGYTYDTIAYTPGSDAFKIHKASIYDDKELPTELAITQKMIPTAGDITIKYGFQMEEWGDGSTLKDKTKEDYDNHQNYKYALSDGKPREANLNEMNIKRFNFAENADPSDASSPYNFTHYDIEVDYVGNCDIEVNWISITDSLADQMYSGHYVDDVVANVENMLNDNIHPVGKTYDYKNQEKTPTEMLDGIENSGLYKLLGIYLLDGDDFKVWRYWNSIRYTNQILNKLGTSSISTHNNERLSYHVGSKHRWVGGVSIRAVGTTISRPYYYGREFYDSDFSGFSSDNILKKYVFEDPLQKHYAALSGIDKFGGTRTNKIYWDLPENSNNKKLDILNSDYETFGSYLNIGTDQEGPILKTNTTYLNHLKDLNDKDYLAYMQQLTGIQYKIEEQFIPFYENYKSLFYNDNWWAQLFVVSNWQQNNIYTNLIDEPNEQPNVIPEKTIMNAQHHSLVYEEVTYMIHNALSMGAKGICYDRQGSYNNGGFLTMQNGFEIIDPSARMNDNALLLYFDKLGNPSLPLDMKKIFSNKDVSGMEGLTAIGVTDYNNSYGYLDAQSKCPINFKTNDREFLKQDVLLGGDYMDINENYNYSLFGTKVLDLNVEYNVKRDAYPFPLFDLNGNKIGGNSVNLPQYLNMDAISLITQKPKDKFYLGQTSQRLAMYDTHKWILENKDEIMNLKLEAWYAKSFKEREFYNPSNSKNELWDYLLKPEGDNKNKWLYKRLNYFLKDDNKFQNYDSAFFDITLHKQRTVSNLPGVKETVYIYVVNRRTDPTIPDYSSYDPLNDSFGVINEVNYNDGVNSFTHKGLTFISRNEFEEKLQSTNSSEKNYWNRAYWERLGCREFYIPFNYNVGEDENYISNQGYHFIRVSEVGRAGLVADNKALDFNSDGIADDSTNSIVDTIIGQDRFLRVKLQPGQGKLLKVEILENEVVEGKLGHPNQPKLVVFPYYKNGVKVNDMYQYHMVYYKEYNLLNPTFDKDIDLNPYQNVWYAVSSPININDPDKRIKWFHNLQVSDRIRSYGILSDTVAYNSDCAYPVIGVNEVEYETGKFRAQVHIAFNCDELTVTELEKNVFIAEAILEVEGESSYNFDVIRVYNPLNSYYDYDQYNGVVAIKRISGVNSFFYDDGDDLKKWGTLAINVSKDKIYYAWSDSSQGIKVAMKGQNDNQNDPWSGVITIPELTFSSGTTNNLHPSFNTYTDPLGPNPNEASLVWVSDNFLVNGQNKPYLQFSELRYTRINNNGALPIIQNYTVQKNQSNYKNYKPSYLGLGLNYYDNIEIKTKFPSVFQDLVRYQSRTFRNDQIVSNIAFFYGQEFPFFISKQNINIYDNNNLQPPFKLNIYNRTSLYGFNSIGMSEASVGPPSIMDIDIVGFAPIIWTMNIPNITFNYKGNVNLIQTSLNGFYYKGRLIGNNDKNIKQIDHGNLNHLAQSQTINMSSSVVKNRMVYNTNNTNPENLNDNILNSPEGFLKLNYEEDEIEKISGWSSTFTNYLLGDLDIDGVTKTWTGLVVETMDSTGYIELSQIDSDTIKSDWFQVDSLTIMKFKCLGMIYANYPLFIEVLELDSLLPIPNPHSMSDTIGTLANYTLINGQNYHYRLCFVNRDTLNSVYSEQYYLGGLNVQGNQYFKTSYNDFNLINLGKSFGLRGSNDEFTLHIYPNPVNQYVNITPIIPKNYKLNEFKRFNIEIIGTIGNSVFNTVLEEGKSLRLNTEQFSSGVYFIKCNEITKSSYDEQLSSSGKFIVK